MKKLLLSSLILLPFIVIAPRAYAQSYTYDCLCLFSEPGGTCVQYTCDAYRRRNTYYGNQYYGNQNCDGRYDRYCSSSNYRPTYRNPYSSSTYYNNSYNNSYGSNYNGYYRQYTNQPTYYDYPSYNNYDSNYHPYYY